MAKAARRTPEAVIDEILEVMGRAQAIEDYLSETPDSPFDIDSPEGQQEIGEINWLLGGTYKSILGKLSEELVVVVSCQD